MDISFIINELGEDRENYYNAIAPPIIQTSNFAFGKVEELRQAFQDEYAAYIYSRGNNPTVNILRQKLAALDGTEDSLVFNSGAAAIYAAVLSNVKAGDHIISVERPYSWAQKIFNEILPRFGVSTTFVDGRNTDNFRTAIRAETRLIYLESPNSWDFALQDLAAVAKLIEETNISRQGYPILSICDNSYASPLYQQPIAMGIDLAMQTATKYIGGHSDTVAGVLCGRHKLIKQIFDLEYMSIGSGIQPFNAWLLLRSLRTLPMRLEKITATTQQVLGFLERHPAVDEVIYPFHKNFPQFELAKKQMQNAGGLLTFILKARELSKIESFCESLRHILMAVSWGGHESLILPACAGILPEDYIPENRQHQMIRLYCGLEDPAYIIKDLQQALATLSD